MNYRVKRACYYSYQDGRDPALRKELAKADRAQEKADKAAEKFEALIQKKRYYRIHAQTKASGKIPQHRLSKSVNTAVHRKLEKDEESNVGVQAAHRTEQAVEQLHRGVHGHQVRRYSRVRHKAEKAEKKLDKANIKVLEKKEKLTSQPSNPISKWQQRRRIRQEYREAKKAAGKSATTVFRPTRSQKVKQWVYRHVNFKTGVFVLAGAYVVGMMVTMFSSCTILFQGGAASSASNVMYLSDDEDILGAEAAYCAMEAELQSTVDSYESTHSYDEYHYELDDIGHDPYVLISMVSAYHRDAWTLDEVQETLEMIFERQYTLSENVEVERRFRIEEEVTPDGQTVQNRVYYDYFICSVTLENFDLSMLPMYILSGEQLSSYSIYMAGLGGRPDLFPESEYVNKYIENPPRDYDVPQEYLDNDPTFAAMMKEAEKYLGYPYVWGGTNPSTSFDCSGYVSWVINHAGWDVGRLGVLSLQALCTPVSAAQAKPGDLVFFENTYDAPLPGPTHVGIYVGDNMFIHCGDPISYASLNEPYWQSHFHSFGKLYD